MGAAEIPRAFWSSVTSMKVQRSPDELPWVAGVAYPCAKIVELFSCGMIPCFGMFPRKVRSDNRLKTAKSMDIANSMRVQPSIVFCAPSAAWPAAGVGSALGAGGALGAAAAASSFALPSSIFLNVG